VGELLHPNKPGLKAVTALACMKYFLRILIICTQNEVQTQLSQRNQLYI
jgi:hypothetical protein